MRSTPPCSIGPQVSTQGYRWWEEAELSDLCSSVGLQGFTKQRQFRFIMFSARKPQAQPADSQEQ